MKKIIETNGLKYMVDISEVATIEPLSYKNEHNVLIRLIQSSSDTHRATLHIETQCKNEQTRVLNELIVKDEL